MNPNFTEQQAEEQLKNNYTKAEEMLKDADKIERFLQRLEKKLKVIPLAGKKLSEVPIMASLVVNYVKKEYQDVPIGTIIAVLSALIYFVSPIDLVPDSLPAIALGLEPHTNDVMEEKPRPMNESILTKDYLMKIGTEGLCIGIMTMAAFLIGYQSGDSILASTMAFGTLCTSRLVHGFNCKSDRPILFKKTFFNNVYLIGAFAAGIILITSVMLIPGLQEIFKVVTLNAGQLMTVYGLALLNLPIVQLMKKLRRK